MHKTIRHRRNRVVATLAAGVAMASMSGVTASASPVLASGTYDSDEVTLRFTGSVSGLDATKIVVYPALSVRTPPFYPVAGTGATDGCSSDATSPTPGVSFGTISQTGGNITTVVVKVQNKMGAGAWAVQIGAGAVSPNDPGCLRFAIPEQG